MCGFLELEVGVGVHFPVLLSKGVENYSKNNLLRSEWVFFIYRPIVACPYGLESKHDLNTYPILLDGP